MKFYSYGMYVVVNYVQFLSLNVITYYKDGYDIVNVHFVGVKSFISFVLESIMIAYSWICKWKVFVKIYQMFVKQNILKGYSCNGS